MSEFPVENLLRKPVEVYSAISLFAASGLLLASPSIFYMNEGTAQTAAAVMLTLGMGRAYQALKLWRYQQNLRILPKFSLGGDEVPVSQEHLYLGKGFRWDKRHTARLVTLQEPQYIHFARPTRLMKLGFRTNKLLENQAHPWAQQAKALLNRDHFMNPVRPAPKVGGFAPIHGVGMWEGEEDIWMDLGERVGHTIVLGTTRVGKTRLAEMFITQDIQRGDVVVVFDPKGDADLMTRIYIEARRAGRLDQLYLFHLGRPDISARYNPIDSFDRVTEVATRVANQLPSEGQSAAFRDFVWRFVNVIARTMTSLGMRINYEELYRVAGAPGRLAIKYFETVLNAKLPSWEAEFETPFLLAQEKKEEGAMEDELTTALRRAVAAARSTKRELRALALVEYLQFKEVNDDIANSLGTMLTNERSYFDKLVSSLYPLLEKLTTGRISELISPKYEDIQDPRPIFTWAEVIGRGGIVYIGLDSLSDYEVGATVGNAMFADLTSLAGKAYNFGFAYGQSAKDTKKRRICIHADEFNELIGDEFIPLLNKSGGAGIAVTAYTQTWSDVEARIGSKPKAEQIAGNFNTMVMLRVKTTTTAEMLTNQLPEVSIATLVPDSSATDTNDPDDFAEFGSKNGDRVASEKVAMLNASDLTQLPKGQAFALIEGGQLVKLRLPLPDASGDGDLPSSVQDLALSLRTTYSKYLRSISEQGEGDELDVRLGGATALADDMMLLATDPVDHAVEQATQRHGSKN